jgi:hypothetical protein
MPRLLPRPRFPLFLLALAVACGSGGDSTAPDDPNNPPPAGGNLPAELVGQWHYELILDNTCDDTGQCVSTANQSETLTLSSNGHFEHVFTGESNFPGCRKEVLHQSEGTAEVQGSSLLLHISEGITRGTDTCGENTNKDEAGETDTYTWELSENNGTPQLTLTNHLGTELGPFDKEE